MVVLSLFRVREGGGGAPLFINQRWTLSQSDFPMISICLLDISPFPYVPWSRPGVCRLYIYSVVIHPRMNFYWRRRSSAQVWPWCSSSSFYIILSCLTWSEVFIPHQISPMPIFTSQKSVVSPWFNLSSGNDYHGRLGNPLFEGKCVFTSLITKG